MRSPLYAFNLDRDTRMFSFAERSGCFFIDRPVLLFTGGFRKVRSGKRIPRFPGILQTQSGKPFPAAALPLFQGVPSGTSPHPVKSNPRVSDAADRTSIFIANFLQVLYTKAMTGYQTRSSITRFKYLSVSARILFRECRGKSGGVVGLR